MKKWFNSHFFYFIKNQICTYAKNRRTQQERPATTKACVMEVIMTREDVKKLFPEATDEQITSLLNQSNSEVATEKAKAEKMKSEMESLKQAAGNAEELQKKIDEIEQGKLTEMEKLTKELEKASNEIATLKKSAAIRDQKIRAAEKFKITAEQANQVIHDDGTMDYDLLGQIIEEKEKNAVSEYEKQKLQETRNPSGGNTIGNENSVAVDIAKASAKRAGTANESILNNYRR